MTRPSWDLVLRRDARARVALDRSTRP
jgi:hypothetical protein